MSSPLQVTIVRAGKEVGTYELAEVLRLLGLGTLKPTDHYWNEGMGDWELLSNLDTSERLKLPAEPEVKRQSDIKSFCSRGCRLFGFFLFLCPGINFVSLCIKNGGLNFSGPSTVWLGAEAYCCGAISLLFLCFFFFNRKM